MTDYKLHEIGDIINGAWEVTGIDSNGYLTLRNVEPLPGPHNLDDVPAHTFHAPGAMGNAVGVPADEIVSGGSGDAWQVPTEAPIVPTHERGETLVTVFTGGKEKTFVLSSEGDNNISHIGVYRDNTDTVKALKRAIRALRNDMPKLSAKILHDAGYPTLAAEHMVRHETTRDMCIDDIEDVIVYLRRTD